MRYAFLILTLFARSLFGQATPPAAVPPDSTIRVAKPTEWWLEWSSDYTRREVMVGSIWRNDAPEPLVLHVVYEMYTEKGDRVGDCEQSQNVAARDSAWFACHIGQEPSHFPLTKLHLQVAGRVRELLRDDHRRLPVTVEATGVQSESSDHDLITAWARVRGADRDIEGSIQFRLYNKDGVQIESCESSLEIIAPDVSKRVASFSYCGNPIPHRLGGVATVRAELVAP